MATLNWDELGLPQLMDHQLDVPFTEDKVKATINVLQVQLGRG
jgi:hypothetical protein